MFVVIEETSAEELAGDTGSKGGGSSIPSISSISPVVSLTLVPANVEESLVLFVSMTVRSVSFRISFRTSFKFKTV